MENGNNVRSRAENGKYAKRSTNSLAVEPGHHLFGAESPYGSSRCYVFLHPTQCRNLSNYWVNYHNFDA
jgi:hypothetical protein